MGLVGQVVWPENLMNEVMVRVKLMTQQSSDVRFFLLSIKLKSKLYQ